MMHRIVAAAFGVLIFIGSAHAQPPSPPDPAAWQGEAASGPILHRASNVTLPAELQGLRRVRVTTVAADDVVASYEARDGAAQTHLSVYLFRPGQLPEHRLRGSLSALATLSPQAFIWSTGPFAVTGPRALHGYKGAFKTGVGADTQMDYLYFFELGTWTVKVRATLNGISDIEQEARVDAFVRALPWEQILAANGDCTGRACTAPAFEPMDHHYTQTMLGRLLFSGSRYDASGEARLPVVGRSQVPLFGDIEIRRSEQGPLLYVATVPRLATYRLMRLPEPVNRLFTESFGRLSIDKPVYALVIRIGSDDLIARLYHGEPTAEVFGAAIRDLVLSETPGPFVPVAQAARTAPE